MTAPFQDADAQPVIITDPTTGNQATVSGGALSVSVAAGTAVIGHVITDSGSTTAVTQTTSPWVVSNSDGAMAQTRMQYRLAAQQAEIFAAQPQNGFVPMTEVPAFLGGF